MNTICYDLQADEQQQMFRRIEDAIARTNDTFAYAFDEDGRGVWIYAPSPSILKQVHQVAFSTFEFPGVRQVGQRYMTRFRLR